MSTQHQPNATMPRTLKLAALAAILFASPGHSETVATKGLNASIVRLNDISKTTNLSLSKTTLTLPKVQLSSSRTFSTALSVKSVSILPAESSSSSIQQKKKPVKSSRRKP